MFGIIMAFEDYNPGRGMLKSPFIGLENFRYMLQISDVSNNRLITSSSKGSPIRIVPQNVSDILRISITCLLYTSRCV